MNKFLDGLGLLITSLVVVVIITAANLYFGGANIEKIIYSVLLVALFIEVIRLKKENQQLKKQLKK